MKVKNSRKIWAIGHPERLVFSVNVKTTIDYKEGLLIIYCDKSGAILFSGPRDYFYTTLE